MSEYEKMGLFDCHVHIEEIRLLDPGAARNFGMKVGDVVLEDAGFKKHVQHIRKDKIQKEYVIFENPRSLGALRRAALDCDINGMYYVRDVKGVDMGSVARMYDDGSVQALKIHPVIDNYELTTPNLARVLTLARRFCLPILFHSDDRKDTWDLTSPKKQEKLVTENRDVVFIIGHGGAYANPRLVGDNSMTRAYWEGKIPRKGLLLSALNLALQNDNVYYDLSIATNRIKAGLIAEFTNVNSQVSEKILVGTDYPIKFSSALSQLRALAGAGMKERYVDRIARNQI
jgi:hypothetical protein